ncbi:ABC transporter permease [Alicyclobacillus hesperidum]|uniref:ABC transporter permease n=1 Tax=Alicyclobacillus hesperidum TaxID=89784 RepID=UPI001E4E9D42|nr:ABC transporter permease [Alicyclobacillus hesperidum]
MVWDLVRVTNMRETLIEVLRNLKRCPLESVLAVVGICFGVGGIFLLSSISAGVRQSIDSEVAAIGPGIMSVQASVATQNLIRESDVQAIAKTLGSQAVVSPVVESSVTMHGRNGDLSGYAIGVDSEFPGIESLTLLKGHFFTAIDNAESRSVCLINTYLVNQLFGGENPVGKQVLVNNIPLTIEGTFEFSNNVSAAANIGEVLLPISTYLNNFTSEDSITEILLKANRVQDIRLIENEVLTQLLRDHQWTIPLSDYSVFTQDNLISSSNSLKHLFSIFVWVADFVSFVVGGIGIMNVMLMAVSDRHKEIGIYLAFGATRRFIIQHFLLESSMLSLVGTVFGILLGTMTGMLLMMKGIPISFNVWVYTEDIAVGVLIGTLFGLYPSLRAATMTPGVALRH